MEEGVEEKKNVGKINNRPRSEGGEGEIKMLSRRVKRYERIYTCGVVEWTNGNSVECVRNVERSPVDDPLA